MTTYYVTNEQLNLIEKAKAADYVLTSIYSNFSTEFRDQFNSMVLGKETIEIQKAVLRYIGGDVYIKFKIKEKMYQLVRTDNDGDRVYMEINDSGTPDWTIISEYAFKAPLEEIKKWQTPACEIEEVTE